MNPTEKQLSVSPKASKGKFPSLVRRSFGTLCILAVCLMTSSCKKREPLNVGAGAVGELKLQPAKFTDAIPDDYGPLIGVTQNARDPAWIGLWFQKADKTVNAVFVNIEQGRIYEKTLTIPRK